MKIKVLFIERKPSYSVSIEKVFAQIAKNLSKDKFEVIFQNVPYRSNLLGICKNLLFYRKAKADIYHITGQNHYIALILSKKNTVLTIHDVGILHIRKGLRRFILKKIFFDLPVKKLKYITAISAATKKEIVIHTGCPPEKIRIIENPLQEHFFISGKKKFDSNCPTILQIGTAPNKNLTNLIKALTGVNCLLKIVGELDEQTTKLLKLHRIKFENRLMLNDEEIRKEYQDCDVVALCSTFEGFGLPIIEAQAMQTPVITSNISPLTEVAGQGAAFADPHNSESIKTGIVRIINDEQYRNNLIRNGLENIRRFQPELIAKSYENLYLEIAEIEENFKKQR